MKSLIENSFDAKWLTQREPFDEAARSTMLEQRFVKAIHTHARSKQSPLRLLDLGCGTGANFRALAPHLEDNQSWIFCDNNPKLLEEALQVTDKWAKNRGWISAIKKGSLEIQAEKNKWCFEVCNINLAKNLSKLDATRYSGVTTTAFLDLVSSEWLQNLAVWMHKSQRPFLATLTVDGRRHWTPEHELDSLINKAFLHHQKSDKGFGKSVGPDAIRTLHLIFEQLDMTCETARSDWHIGPKDIDMLKKMIDETVEVVIPINPNKSSAIKDWSYLRYQQALVGDLHLTIGHLDLLALPKNS